MLGLFVPRGSLNTAAVAFSAICLIFAATDLAHADDVPEAILHSFSDQPNDDGAQPFSPLTLGPGGFFYGATSAGGSSSDGTVYKISSSGQYSVIYSFNGYDAAFPTGPIVFDSAGNLYGTTQFGGSAYEGTIYSISPSGMETTLYSFTGNADGEKPQAGVTLGNDGYLYGTTSGSYGSTGNTSNGGTIFRIKPDGSNFQTLFLLDPSDTSTNANGGYPVDPLVPVPGSATAFYGVCRDGGSAGDGTAFQFVPGSNSGGAYTILHTFNDGSVANDAIGPSGALQIDSSGNLYGGSANGGLYGYGAIFEITPSGSSSATKVLYSLLDNNGDDVDGVIIGSDGNLYGTTTFGGDPNYQGVVFRVAKDGTGFTDLYVFSDNGSSDADRPVNAPVEDASGDLLGTTQDGGSYTSSNYQDGAGTVYKVSAAIPFPTSSSSLKSVVLSPTSAQGGSAPTTANRIYWSGNAPSNETVTLKSSNTAVATVPSTVTISSGSSSHTFTITTKAVTSTQTVTITATSGGVTKTAILTVTPPPAAGLKSVVLSPTSTEGGSAPTTANRVYWTGNAPAGEVVTLKSSNTAAATVPSSVTISSGSSSHTFTITTKDVTTQQTVTITATSGGMSQTATLTVTP